MKLSSSRWRVLAAATTVLAVGPVGVAAAAMVDTSPEAGAPSSASPEAAKPLGKVATAILAQAPSRFEQTEKLEQRTDLAGVLAARRGRLEVSSPKGSHVWTASDLADHGLPSAAVKAYKAAAATMATQDPACQLPWTLLAGIGRVESDHGRYGGSVLGNDGVSHPHIIGIPLNGVGPVAAIHDTDHGRWDGDKVWDRAVGPMQFIPGTWASSGRDGDGDGVKDPNDLDDAALAAAGYLCAGSGSVLGSGMAAAIYRYNASDYYVDLVMAFETGYRTGVFDIPPPPVEAAPQKHKKHGRHGKHGKHGQHGQHGKHGQHGQHAKHDKHGQHAGTKPAQHGTKAGGGAQHQGGGQATGHGGTPHAQDPSTGGSSSDGSGGSAGGGGGGGRNSPDPGTTGGSGGGSGGGSTSTPTPTPDPTDTPTDGTTDVPSTDTSTSATTTG